MSSRLVALYFLKFILDGVPQASLSEGQWILSKETLPLSVHYPLSFTFGIISNGNEILLADPTSMESPSLDACMTCWIHPLKHHLVKIMTVGPLSSEIIQQCVDLALNTLRR